MFAQTCKRNYDECPNVNVETTDVKAYSPPQLPPPTVKTCIRLNGSDAPNAVYCSLFSVCV